MITSRRKVTKLILGHNKLSDDGCIILFRFLGSPAGRKYRIAEISLNSNEIGDRGLLAIAAYLNGNQHLTELFLQNVSSIYTFKVLFSSLLELIFRRPLSHRDFHERYQLVASRNVVSRYQYRPF